MRSRNAGLNMQGKKDATSMRNRNALEGKKARKGKTKAYPQRIRARIRSAEARRTCHAGANNPLSLGATTISVDHKTTLRV